MERRLALGGAVQYPVAMEMKYKTRTRTPSVGVGQTTWMSNRDVVFTTDQPIPEGTLVEISLAWPALLNQCVALQLVVEGKIIHCREKEMTAHILKHHFRTRGPWHREEDIPRPVLVYARPLQPPNEQRLCAS